MFGKLKLLKFIQQVISKKQESLPPILEIIHYKKSMSYGLKLNIQGKIILFNFFKEILFVEKNFVIFFLESIFKGAFKIISCVFTYRGGE